MLLRAWIARGAVWCPPQARHGLSITHLSAGCQGFEALSKASAAADRRAKTVWKMFAQMDTRTAPREAQRDCTTPRLIGFDIGLSTAASAPRMDPNTSACGSPPWLRCQWHIRCCRNNAAREKFWHVLRPLGRAMRGQRKITARCAHSYGERVEV